MRRTRNKKRKKKVEEKEKKKKKKKKKKKNNKKKMTEASETKYFEVYVREPSSTCYTSQWLLSQCS
jgi:hypothetical protein